MNFLHKMKLQNTPSRAFWTSIYFVLLFHCMYSLVSQHASSTASHVGNQTDQLALLQFKHEIANDPLGILNSWNHSLHHCRWQGITCGRRHQRVTALNLSDQSLFGSLSPHIGNLSFLKSIILPQNKFYGKIPQQIGYLFRLRYLNLTNNALGGAVPVNLSHCLELRVIDMSRNKLVGNIPRVYGSLKKLVLLRLGVNNLTGSIPHSFGNLSNLERILLPFNNFEGSIPTEIGQLTRLNIFATNNNYLFGTIPPSLYNISSLTVISIADNQINGSLPINIGLTLPNLQIFGVGGNQFSGTIPISFTNASELVLLDLPDNNFVGQVPVNLGSRQNFQWLNVGSNMLGSNTTHDLSFITSLSNCSNLIRLHFYDNNFGGEMPSSIGNLSQQIKELGLGRNQVSGIIPTGLENLANGLYLLGMEQNLFSGTIPSYFGKFLRLQALYLEGNRLSGNIPSSLGNNTQLYTLKLGNNKLRGDIPSTLGNCQHLIYLDLSHNELIGVIPNRVLTITSLSVGLNFSENSLTGSLPLEVGTLKSLNALDISKNKLSGEIPKTIGSCLSLEYLNMQGNFFQGTIPSTLGFLKGILYLDLSHNNLSGQIPKNLESLPLLQYLNLSLNELEGEVPTKGVFSNASAIFVVGNSKLCGGIPELQLPSCIIQANKKRKPLAFNVTIIVVSMVLFFLAITSFGVLYWRRKTRHDPSTTHSRVDRFLRISYHELYQATAGFSPSNLIGSGSFGFVYKARLDNQEERLVAIKVLNVQRSGASKSFMAECRALRNIRHRNLVKILTYCSSIDFKGNEFKALVYEYMENGSLDMWLQQVHRSRTLTLIQRLNIAIDVASALHYLQNYCGTPIIHCDLKPSNILLDNDMTAHISDFGLARLLPKIIIDHSQKQTSSMGIKGSIGYAAPEYGMGSGASTYGDVYSYGILILEMFTGRRPTDNMFKDDLNLPNYVKMALPNQVIMIVDPILIAIERETEKEAAIANKENEDDNTEIAEDIDNNHIGSLSHEKCIVSLLQIGLACSAESPKERMEMHDVLRELYNIKGAILGGEINKNKPHMVM